MSILDNLREAVLQVGYAALSFNTGDDEELNELREAQNAVQAGMDEIQERIATLENRNDENPY